MLSDKMAVNLVLETIRLLGLTAGSPKTPLCLDWIIWQVASSWQSQEEDYSTSKSFIPPHCPAARTQQLRTCADSNIETRRQKTFVPLNKMLIFWIIIESQAIDSPVTDEFCFNKAINYSVYHTCMIPKATGVVDYFVFSCNYKSIHKFATKIPCLTALENI